jgi:hypothetical protein
VIPNARFLFDECLARPTVEGIIADSLRLHGAAAEVAHLLTKFPPGTADSIWIPEIAKEGGWVVITCDRGMHSRVGEKLPLICRHFCVTHVLMGPALSRRTMRWRAVAIQSVWDELIEVAAAPAGTGFALTMAGSGFRLTKKTDPIPPDPKVPPWDPRQFPK